MLRLWLIEQYFFQITGTAYSELLLGIFGEASAETTKEMGIVMKDIESSRRKATEYAEAIINRDGEVTEEIDIASLVESASKSVELDNLTVAEKENAKLVIRTTLDQLIKATKIADDKLEAVGFSDLEQSKRWINAVVEIAKETGQSPVSVGLNTGILQTVFRRIYDAEEFRKYVSAKAAATTSIEFMCEALYMPIIMIMALVRGLGEKEIEEARQNFMRDGVEECLNISDRVLGKATRLAREMYE